MDFGQMGQMGWLVHFAPVVAMLLVITLNRRAMKRQNSAKAVVDGLRLRAGLRSELKFLLEVYQRNLLVLRAGDGVLLSGRPLTAVYRTNSARLIALDEAEIPAIVAAYSFIEAVEGLVAATMRSGPGHAHKLKSSDLSLADIERQVAIGCDRIAAALAAIDDAASQGKGYRPDDGTDPFASDGLTLPSPLAGLTNFGRVLSPPDPPPAASGGQGTSRTGQVRAIGFPAAKPHPADNDDEESVSHSS
jgi:hypothetical protein